jgi:serine/threonine protein kinase
METIIGKKYRVLEKIGSGAFGNIYKGENIRTREKVAIKMEICREVGMSLPNEARIYYYLNGFTSIPNLRWFGVNNNNYYMVMDLLGVSLVKNNNISLSDTIIIGNKIIDILKYIHEKGLVHRDIKPENFVFGINENKGKLYIVDFGLTKRYIRDDTEHIEFKKTKNIIGSLNYCSINSHNLYELSRRDDLESLGYLLVYLQNSSLPWDKIISKEDVLTEKINYIENKNDSIFKKYFNYIRNIGFKDKPNYEYLKELLDL